MYLVSADAFWTVANMVMFMMNASVGERRRCYAGIV